MTDMVLPQRGIPGLKPGPFSIIVKGLQLGESCVAQSVEEYNRARWWQQKLKPRRFVIEKIPRVGWRVLRVA